MAGHEELVTYLSLTQAFGGTRFGPFEGLEVRLGSDPDRCHIVLPEALGVVKEHVRLIRQGPLNLILAPADRTATVFLYKQGERRPTQLYTPTAVRPGDSFALVTQDGPRFVVEADELPPEIKEQREEARRVATGRRRLSAESMATETKRQIWTRLLVLGPAQLAQRAWLYIQSGAIYQPRNIFLAVTIASGWIFGGAMSCRGRSTRAALATTTERVESCETELGVSQDLNKKDDLSISDLAVLITKSTLLGTDLKEDKNLYTKVKEEAANIYNNRTEYEWFYTDSGRKSTEFKGWRQEVLDSKLHPDTARLLVWLGAQPGNRRYSEHNVTFDSNDEYSCTLGPAGLTYRQALRLGVEAMPDAHFYGDIRSIEESNEQMEEKVAESLGKILATPMEGAEYEASSMPNNADHCIYQTGSDDRERRSKVLSRLSRNLSDGAAQLPPAANVYGPTSRIALLYAADLVRYDDKSNVFNFQGRPTSSTIDGFEKGKGWVLERTAELIARSIVLPCLLRMEGEEDAVKAMLEDSAPTRFPCLYLYYELQNPG